jgi:polar amino acid transport system substrate-binding protein
MKRLAAICAAAVLVSSAGHAADLLVLTEEFKPYQYEGENGQPTGFMVELVGGLFETAGVGMEGGGVRILPWAEAYDRLLTTDNAAAFMTVRNEEREGRLKWVGPLAPREVWLYRLKSRDDIDAATLDEARKYRVAAYQSAQSDYLLALGFEDVAIAPQERQNVERLLAGDVDLAPSLELMMAQRLRDLGSSYRAVAKVALLDDRYDYYLALNLNTPDTVVEKLQAALDEARRDGTYDRLEAKYLAQVAGEVSAGDQP